MTKNIEFLDKIISWGIAFTVFLVPLFFLPITTNFYEFNKQALLIISSSFLLLAWSLRLVLSKTLTLKITPFDLPVLLFLAAWILSTVLRSVNKFEALLQPGTTGTMIVLTIFYFLLVNNIGKKEIGRITHALLFSGVLLSLIAIYQFIGIASSIIPTDQLDWLKPQSFTPTGNLLALTVFLIILLPFSVTKVMSELKNQNYSLLFLLYTFFTLFLLSGIGLAGYQLLTTTKPISLPQITGWQIAIEAIKNSPLFGVGPTNFLSAFTQFKPMSFNLTSYWSVLFGVSSNFYFQVLTTIGFLGLGALAFLIFNILKVGFKNIKSPAYPSIFLTLILFLFFPVSFLSVFTFFVLLGLAAVLSSNREYEEKSRVIPWLVTIPLTLVIIFTLFSYSRFYLSEYYFKNSLDELTNNQGTNAYNLQIKAISLNPNQPVFRVTYAKTSFAIANAIAQKKDLSDQDRQNISILVQQAIREAKTAVTLNPQDVSAWENLALTYRALINFADGADTWTIAAYQEAINLDPYNPNLRLSLGGVYYGLHKWEEAQKLFEQVVILKPDYANGYYNLAAVFKEKGDLTQAIKTMESTLSLTVSGSEDWKKANQELGALKKRASEKAAAVKEEEKKAVEATSSLNPPEPLPEGLKPPLTLPTEAAPEVSPTPEATPTP